MKIPSLLKKQLFKPFIELAYESYKEGKADHLNDTFDAEGYKKALQDKFKKNLPL